MQVKHWRTIFYQILSVLAIIHAKYPSFRHNDMKANNILIHKIDITKDYHRYIVVRNKYKVPNIGYQIKLWDFDFACIPGIVDNIKVQAKWTKKINVTPEQNRYYDVHYFFCTLIYKGFLPELMTESIIPNEVKEFIDDEINGDKYTSPITIKQIEYELDFQPIDEEDGIEFFNETKISNLVPYIGYMNNKEQKY